MPHIEGRSSWYWSFVSRPSPNTPVSAFEVYLQRCEAIRSHRPEPFPDAVIVGLDSDEVEWHSRPIASMYLAGERNIHEEDGIAEKRRDSLTANHTTPTFDTPSSHPLVQQRAFLPAAFPTSSTPSATPLRRFSSPVFSSSHQTKQSGLPTHTLRREAADGLFGSRRSSLPISRKGKTLSTSSPLASQNRDSNVRRPRIPNLDASLHDLGQRVIDRSDSPSGLAGLPAVATPVDYPELPEPEEDLRQAFIDNNNQRQRMAHFANDTPRSAGTPARGVHGAIFESTSASDSGYCGSDSLSEAARQGEGQDGSKTESDEPSPADELFRAFGDAVRGVAGAFGFGGEGKTGG